MGLDQHQFWIGEKILFLIVIHVTLSQSQWCTTMPTVGGTKFPEFCVIPFKFQGKTYTSCTREHDDQNKAWCSVQVNRNGNHISGQQRWGHCNPNSCQIPRGQSRLIVAPTKPDTDYCITVGGRKPNRICQLPFIFNARTYFGCTTDSASDGIPWCSTRVDQNSSHITGNWGHCRCSKNDEKTDLTTSNPVQPRYDLASQSQCKVTPIYAGNFSYVINGDDALPSQFPFATLIGARRHGFNRVNYKCGGSLITRKHVLSAGHCYNPQEFDYIEVLIGENTLGTNPDCINLGGERCSDPVQKIKIERVIPHPQYDIQGPVNDIAVIRLSNEARLSPSVRPICLAYPPDDPEQSNRRLLTVTGWGRIHYSSNGDFESLGVASKTLQFAQLSFRNQTECQSYYFNLDSSRQVCAGMTGKDSCKGDSGGPLFYLDNDSPVQVGIVSHGSRFCGDGRPAVYTRVSAFRDWIDSQLF